MKKIYNSTFKRILADKSRQTTVMIVILLLCIVVIPSVAVLLSQTALTEKTELVCELEEHSHNEECFAEVLNCNLSETEEHSHSSGCYEDKEALICETEESAEHTHAETCYETIQNLICEIKETHTHADACYLYEYNCELEEIEIHTHNENCYSDEPTLMCDKDESHSDDCYYFELTCEIEDTEENHIHNEECLNEEPTLMCGKDEISPHTHNEECYRLELSCEHEEHSHAETCFASVKGTMQNMSVMEFDGEGIQSNPYIISSALDLQKLSELVKAGDANYISSVYKLEADINLSVYGVANTSFNSGKGWIPIGTKANPFSGTFDGNGYGISGLSINDNNLDNAGLFGYVQSGTIQNVAIEGTSIGAKNYVGGLIGYASGTIVSNSYSICWVFGVGDVGGLVGYITGGTEISNCYTTKGVHATTGNAGGVVGGVQNSGSNKIATCFAAGEVVGTETASSCGVGGIVGIKNASLTVRNCAAVNTKITSSISGNAKRIVSNTSGGTLTLNYAFTGIINSSGTTTWSNPSASASGANGANIDSTTVNLSSYWSSTIGFSTSTWTLVSGKLPTLKNVGGTQPSNQPSHWGHHPFSSGSGTSSDPFIITTAEQLAWLAARVTAKDAAYTGSASANKYYKLGNDIDLSMYNEYYQNSKGRGWAPIGDTTDAAGAFRGTFDGNGKKITGLYINRTSVSDAYSALFGYVYGATIKNLSVVNANVYGHVIVAGIVASLANGGTVEDCYVTGSITGYQAVGGIVGVLNSGGSGTNTIRRCYTTASITARNFRAGGIAGNCVGNALITDCYSTGTISNPISALGQTTQSGGILGAPGGGSVTIMNCYSTGNISSRDFAGGIVGGNSIGTCTIRNSAALNLEIRGNFGSNRIKAGSGFITLTNNYAYEDIKNKSGNTEWEPKGTLTNENGLDITAENALKADFWSNTMGWNGSTVWLLEDGKLPVLRGLDGQSSVPHFEVIPPSEDAPLVTVRINCEKILEGSNFPIDKNFIFKLTEVDKNGTPVTPSFEMENSITGAGMFWFDVPIYAPGTYYYKIMEEAGVRDGWIYDDHSHIVEVNVADDAGHTVITSLDGSSETKFTVTFGSPTTIHVKPNPPIIFDITTEKRYNFTGTSYTNFIISGEGKKYFGLCGNYSLQGPSSTRDIYQLQSNGVRNDRASALAAALSVSGTGGFQNGTGLTEAEYASLFGIRTPAYQSRRSTMQDLVWHYENNERISSSQTSLKNIINDMINASNNTPAGQSITSLSIGYDQDTSRITFTHVGYQPMKYDARLTWTGDTNGLIVMVNGNVVSSGAAIQKTDIITATYTGDGSVEFFITDHQLYLKAGSVKGGSLKNITNSRIQPCMLGSAEFVKIQNSFKITRHTTSEPPTSVIFVNKFEKLPTTSATIIGDKTVTGLNSTDETFTFRLTQVTDIGGATAAAPLYTDSTTVTGSGSFSFVIDGLHPGTYFFRIEEDSEAPPEGWVYDNISRIVQVDVSYDSTPSVSIIYPNGGLTFNNRYKPSGGSTTIEGKKRVEGTDIPNQIFSFKLIQVADIEGTPYTEGEAHMDSEITNGAGTFRFAIKDLIPGTYYYQITEVPDNPDQGWTYDDSVYIAMVVVKDVGEIEYDIEVSYYKDEADAEEIVFTNHFSPPRSTEVVINGNKKITGVDSTDKEFKFLLERVTNESGNDIFLPAYREEASTIGAGEFSFILSDLLPGTYHFKITENTDDADVNWQYDRSIHVITVTVSEELEIKINSSNGGNELCFTNKFRPSGILPETGGIGTNPFTVAAIVFTSVLIIFLFGILIYKLNGKRRLLNVK